jgi:hypothetical protein
MPLAGVAAALLLLVLGWRELILPKRQTSAVAEQQVARADPLVDQLRKINLKLAKNSIKRAEALAAMAGHIAEVLPSLGQEPDLRNDLASLCDKIGQSLTNSEREARNSIPAGPSRSSPADAERLRQLRRNQKLIHALVQSSLKLLDQATDNPLQRAEGCHELVQHLADEVKLAAREREGFRAREMSGYLRELLSEGVADNLTNWKKNYSHSAFKPEMDRVKDWVEEILAPAEAELEAVALAAPGAERHDLEFARIALQEGRAFVRSASGQG